MRRTCLTSHTNRLTNTSPFIEPTDTQDIKLKIINRTIDWQYLKDHGRASAAGEQFLFMECARNIELIH